MSQGDRAEYRRSSHFAGIELLTARYTSQSFVPHFHETYAIGVVEAGALTQAYRHQFQKAYVSGDVIVIAPGEVHTGRSIGSQGVTYRMMYLPVEVVEPYFNQTRGFDSINSLREGPGLNSTGRAAAVIDLFNNLAHPGTSRLQLEISFLTCLNGFDQTGIGSREKLVTRPHDPGIQRAREFIDANFSSDISLDQLAAIANFSPYYFVHQFRGQIGLPPHSYQNWLRITQAKRLLSCGRDTTSVAVEIGFYDQSHFIKVFKRYVGVVPGKYSAKAQ
jgi:AraC-like DNA-binding protein